MSAEIEKTESAFTCGNVSYDIQGIERALKYQRSSCLPTQAFSVVFQKAVERASPDETLKERVLNLIDSITFSVFQYTTRGLFECDKLTYTAQVTFQVKNRSSLI